MRAFKVDERDSSWERFDPRFRLYLFSGEDSSTVTTVDLVDVGIGQALATASELSGNDEHLWALASVENDQTGERGLVWLSGTDYNGMPGTADEWRYRREMQWRYLKVQVSRGKEPRLPNGLRLIEMHALWSGGWPLWELHETRRQLTAQDLRLSAELGEALHDWNSVWQRHDETGPIPEGWIEHGMELWPLLQTELDGVAEVSPSFLAYDESGVN